MRDRGAKSLEKGHEIEISNSQRVVTIHPQKIRRIAKEVLSHFRLRKGVRLNILFLDDAKISILHKRFLGKKGPTDVLAFGMQEGKVLKGDPFLLGDIAISTETALRQAKRFHSPVGREVALYVIHGILHLLGYDDRKKSARLLMRRKEKELLKRCQDDI